MAILGIIAPAASFGFIPAMFGQSTAQADSNTAPGAPTHLPAAPGDSEVTFTWQEPLSDGGSAICTEDGRMLSRPLSLTVPGPEVP